MKAEATTESAKQQRLVVGKVVSNKMDKTIIVQVEYKVKHELYGKYIKRFSKMVAHDKDDACKEGDIVSIKETRPLSKTKRWALVEVIRSNDQ